MKSVLCLFLVVSLIVSGYMVYTEKQRETQKESQTKAEILNSGRYAVYLAANYGGADDMPTIESAHKYVETLNKTFGVPLEDFYATGHVRFAT